MRIGIFGGTFNPIHYGHLRAAEEVRERLELAKVIFVPSYLPAHKELAAAIPGTKRLQTVRLAIQDNPHFEVSSFEVDAGGKSYSIRTIEQVREQYQTTPYFILGQDSFNEIMTWHAAPKHFDISHFAVMSRPGASWLPLTDILGDLSNTFKKTDKGFRNKGGCEIISIDVTPFDISSSAIRALCREGRTIKYLVPPEVEAYIIAERMYS